MLTLLTNYIQKKKPDYGIREVYGEAASIIGLLSNIVLAVSKIVIGILVNSIAILGDGINNFTDCISSIISFLSFRISAKAADEQHPFGHARAEFVFSGIVSFIILYIGLKLVLESILKIINAGETDYNIFTLVVLVLSIAVKFWQYLFYKKIDKKIDSELMKATAVDSLSDVLSTGAILISVLISYFFNLNLDGYIGLLVAGLIIKVSIELLSDTYNKLIGSNTSITLVQDIKKDVMSFKGVQGVHDITIHEYGPSRRYLTMDINVDGSLTVADSHEISNKIELFLLQNYQMMTTIHIDPVGSMTEEENMQAQRVNEFMEATGLDYLLRDFHITRLNDDRYIQFDLVISHDQMKNKKGFIEDLKETLKKENPGFEYQILLHHDDWQYEDENLENLEG